jgi:hypothetical protein
MGREVSSIGFWDDLADDTAKCIANVPSASQSTGNRRGQRGVMNPAAKKLPAVPPEIPDTELMEFYRDTKFMPSCLISQMKLP